MAAAQSSISGVGVGVGGGANCLYTLPALGAEL